MSTLREDITKHFLDPETGLLTNPIGSVKKTINTANAKAKAHLEASPEQRAKDIEDFAMNSLAGGTIVGQGSKLFNQAAGKAALKHAADSEGLYSNPSLWSKLKTYIGADSLPRQEVSDLKAKVLRQLSPGESTTLSSVLDHPTLYQHYPHLKDLPVQQGGKGSAYDGSTLSLEQADLSPILHETQHAIQKHEGFARGGAPSEFTAQALQDVQAMQPRVPFQDIPLTTALQSHKLYKKLGGETEARAVQARQALTDAERAARWPGLDHDVDFSEQVIKKYPR